MGKVYAAILAGGSGSRMGNPDKPKQFWDLGGRPVIAQTIEKFCLVQDFDEIIVLPPENWIAQMHDIVKRYLCEYAARIIIAPGGADRNGTIASAISYIEREHGINEDDVIVTHDAVRPFVTYRIIKENIEAARKYGACDTVIPATDTIVHSSDGHWADEIPKRSELYLGQTPQSFNIRELKELFEKTTLEERSILTDACKVLVLRGRPVALVRGDICNIKLTYTNDMRIARAMLENED